MIYLGLLVFQIIFKNILSVFTNNIPFFQDLTDTTSNTSDVVWSVYKRVQQMRQYQQISRGYVKKDHKLLSDNFNYVTRQSIAQVTLVLICGAIQISFVKKLFESTTSNLKAKA